MINFNTYADTRLAGEFDERWDGFEDESDWEYAMQFDDREDDGWSERYDYPDDEFMGAEDAFLDSYWEGEAEAAFWGGE